MIHVLHPLVHLLADASPATGFDPVATRITLVIDAIAAIALLPATAYLGLRYGFGGVEAKAAVKHDARALAIGYIGVAAASVIVAIIKYIGG